uniref:Protein asunder n=1 Tax=Romanomermis culicivorax TaxID=13658 RepID=A0A915JDL3_ROMCU
MDVSYKTVFVLDHGPYFAAKCVQPVDVGAASKFEDSKISKSLWTCCVEVALEYRRIMLDLFQRDTKFIRFVLSDSIGRFLTPDWGEDSNRLENIWFNIFEAGQPDPSVEENCSIINGLSLAVEALIQSTKIQIEQKKNGVPVQNCGRIVVVTHLESSENMIDIHRHVGGLIGSHNKLANYLGDSFSPLNEVEMCFVNIRNEDSKSNNGSEFWKNESRKTMISSILKSEFIELYGGDDLNSAFYSLIQRHFDLTSTTISGVPMKEEKCLSSQSANYDIELLHPRDVHKNLAKRLCE